jgi:flagellar biogenesis protein FliO
MEMVQQIAAVAGVLALLMGTLWWLRSRGLAGLPARRKGGARLEVLERVQLAPQHALHLVRLGGRLLLVAVSPAGCTLLDSSVPESGPGLQSHSAEAIR